MFIYFFAGDRGDWRGLALVLGSLVRSVTVEAYTATRVLPSCVLSLFTFITPLSCPSCVLTFVLFRQMRVSSMVSQAFRSSAWSWSVSWHVQFFDTWVLLMPTALILLFIPALSPALSHNLWPFSSVVSLVTRVFRVFCHSSLVKSVTCHQFGLSPAWVVYSVICHSCVLLLGCLVNNVTCHWSVLSPVCLIKDLSCHQCDLSLTCQHCFLSPVRLVIDLSCHQCVLSLTRLVTSVTCHWLVSIVSCHQCVLSLTCLVTSVTCDCHVIIVSCHQCVLSVMCLVTSVTCHCHVNIVSCHQCVLSLTCLVTSVSCHFCVLSPSHADHSDSAVGISPLSSDWA